MKHDWRARRCRNVETLLIIFGICSVLMSTLTKQTIGATTERLNKNETSRFSFMVFHVKVQKQQTYKHNVVNL